MVYLFAKIMLFLFGIFLMVIGFSTFILYINLLSSGYNFKEYINYIIKVPEFYYFFIGFVFINISVFIKGEKNDKRI